MRRNLRKRVSKKLEQAGRPRITITATLECASVDSESYAESDSRALARHAVGYPRPAALSAPCGVDSPRKQGLLQIVDSPHPSALDALARAPPSALVARVLALRGSCCSVSALPSLLCHDCGLVEEGKVSGGGFERSQYVDCSVVWYSMVEEMGRENPTSKAIVPVAVGMLADWLLQRQVPVPMQEVVLRLRQKLFANRGATPG